MSAELTLGLPWESYAAPGWLGSSALSDWLEMGRAAWAEKWLATGYGSTAPSKWMIAGSELDMMLTSADYDASRIALKPTGMKFSTKEGKAWKEANEGKVILDEKVSAELAATLPMVREAIAILVQKYGSEPEYQVTLRGQIAGLNVQSRPDIKIGRLFPDLKYVNSDNWTRFVRTFYRSRYWLQAGLNFGLARDAGIEDPRPSFLIAESGTVNPRVKVWTISEELCLAAWRDVCTRCEEIAGIIEAGGMVDPVQFDTMTAADLPGWAQKEI